MKSKKYRLLLPPAILVCAASVLHAADQTWDDANGNNIWNTSNSNWVSPTTWVSGSTAVFGGTGETVTLGSAITAGGITFNAGATNYEIAGGGFTLTLAATTGFVTANETAKISGAVAVGASPTITVAGAKTLTMSGAISGAAGGTYTAPNYTAGLTKTGAGTLILAGTNTYTGLTIVSQGVIRAQTNTAFGGGAAATNYVVVNSGAAVEVDSTYGTATKRFHVQGTGIGGTGAIRNLGGNNALSGNNYLTGAARINSDAGTLSLGQLNPTVSGGSVTSALTVGGAGNVAFVNYGTSSSVNVTSLTKDGAGTLTIGASVVVSSATAVDLQDGIMQLVGSIPTAATLNLGGIGGTSGKLILGGAAAIKDQTVAGLTSAGSGAFNAIVGGNPAVSTLTVNLTSGTNTYAGKLGGGGTNENALGISKSGTAGTLILSGSNTYTGPTTVTSGTLVANGAAALGSTSGISIGGGGVLSLRADSSANFAKVSDSSLYAVSASASGATINVDQATVAGAAAKTMTIGTLGSTSTAATYQLNFTGANNSGLTVGAVTGPASTALGTVTLSNSNTTGALTLESYNSANTTGGESLKFAGAGNTTVSGAITPSATVLEVLQNGSGIVTLNGSSTYTGSTTVSSGTLRINSIADYGMACALGYGNANTPASPIVIGSASESGILEYTGGAATTNRTIRIGSTGAGTSGSGTINNNGSGALVFTDTGFFNAQNLSTNSGRTLTLGGLNAGANEIKGVIRDMSGTGGTIAVTKADGGTWILSGANSYTGATTVTGGTLALGATGSVASTSIVAGGAGSSGAVLDVSAVTGGYVLGAPQTLSGIGTVAGDITINGAISPGNSGIGTLHAGNTTWNGGGTSWKFNLADNSGSADTLAITGSFSKGSGSGFVFDFLGSAPNAWGNTYTLATFTSSSGFVAGDFTSSNLTGSYTNGFFTLNSDSLVFTAIPEPTSALAGLLLGAGLLRRRRRA